MKTQLCTFALLATFLLMGTTAMAQNCKSSCSKSKTTTTTTTNSGFNVANNGAFVMSMNFARERTTAVQNYLEKELGRNFTTHAGSLKRWTSFKSKAKTDGLKIALSNGHIKIQYKGKDDDTFEEVQALAREVQHLLCEDKKKKGSTTSSTSRL